MVKESELLMLKRNAIMLGLCGEYKGKWDSCITKKELVDMALDSNGVEFMADSMAFEWGLSKEYLQREFEEYMNGLYQRSGNGYTSEMYVGAHGIMKLKSTITLIAYCDGLEIDVPEHFIGKVYVCGGSNVKIENKGGVELYVYGKNAIKLIEHDNSYSVREDVVSSKWDSPVHNKAKT